MLNKHVNRIVEDLNKCDKSECKDCAALLTNKDGDVCLALIIMEYNQTLKHSLEELLEKF